MKTEVIHGDCLIEMQKIPDKSVDMILCDLPYGTTACKWDTIIPFEPLWEQYKRIIKDNGSIVLTASQPFTSALVMSNVKMFKYSWVWLKSNISGNTLAKRRPMKGYEDILVFGNKTITYKPQGLRSCYIKRNDKKTVWKNTPKKYIQNVTGYPKNVLEFKSEKGLHPTQKPVALFEYLIKTYTNEGDLVLDNCAGSGTTGVACKNLNRNYILIEKEKEYVDIINKRLSL